MEGTVDRLAVFYPPLDEPHRSDWVTLGSGIFDWTDQDELIFQVYSPPLNTGVARWRKGKLEILFSGVDRLGAFPGTAPPSISGSAHLVQGGGSRPLIGILAIGPEPSGVYQAKPDQFREYVFPTVACLEGGNHEYHSGFVIHNPGTEEAHVKIFLYESPGKVRLTEDAVLVTGQTKLIPIQGQSTFAGWARVEVTGGDVVINERLQFFEGGDLRSQMQLPPTVPKHEAFFVTPGSTSTETALAFVNPYNAEQEVWVEVLRPGWEIRFQERVVIPAGGRCSYYLPELFATNVPYFSLVRVRSTWPLALSLFAVDHLRMTPRSVF
jgi:hypothetical protein